MTRSTNTIIETGYTSRDNESAGRPYKGYHNSDGDEKKSSQWVPKSVGLAGSDVRCNRPSSLTTCEIPDLRAPTTDAGRSVVASWRGKWKMEAKATACQYLGSL